MDIPDSIFEHAPWSPSKASAALTCSHNFQLRYVKKEPATDVDAFATTVGTTVHQILEWTIQREARVAISKAFAHALNSFPLTYEMQQSVLTYRDAVEDFVKNIEEFDRNQRITQILTEKKLALRPDWTLTKFGDKQAFMQGVIDLVLVTAKNRAVIIDHKTGAMKEMSLYQEQVETYSVFMDVLIPKLNSVQMAIHYVGADPNISGKRTTWSPVYTMETVRTQFRQNLINYLTKAAEAAKTDIAKACWKCRFCGYRSHCSEAV